MTSLLSALFRRTDRRRAYSDLLSLDDHLLRDIGVNRFDLGTAVRTGRGTPNGRGPASHRF